MKKKPTQRTNYHKGTPFYCYFDDRTMQALEVIANGNKTRAVSQAIIDAADRLRLTESLKTMDDKP